MRCLPLLALAACGGDALRRAALPHDDSDDCQTGAVHGSVCLPGTSRPLAGAEVSLVATDCSGEPRRWSDTVGADARFVLVDVPAGPYVVEVEHPEHRESFEVRVRAGEIVRADAPGAACVGPVAPRLAVITGRYDAVEVLLGQLGLAYDLFDGGDGESGSAAGGLLGDLEAMRNYDVLFFDCGSLDRDFLAGSVGYGASGPYLAFDFDAPVYRNLRAFVAGGASVYVSDWAWPIAEGIAGPALDFRGSENADGTDVIVGARTELEGAVEDERLATFLATGSVHLAYDLDSWAVLDQVEAPAAVLVSGQVSDDSGPIGARPLLVRVQPSPGSGSVLYTTFHHHAQPPEQMLAVLRWLILQL
jgi:hypothetical protein